MIKEALQKAVKPEQKEYKLFLLIKGIWYNKIYATMATM